MNIKNGEWNGNKEMYTLFCSHCGIEFHGIKTEKNVNTVWYEGANKFACVCKKCAYKVRIVYKNFDYKTGDKVPASEVVAEKSR